MHTWLYAHKPDRLVCRHVWDLSAYMSRHLYEAQTCDVTFGDYIRSLVHNRRQYIRREMTFGDFTFGTTLDSARWHSASALWILQLPRLRIVQRLGHHNFIRKLAATLILSEKNYDAPRLAIACFVSRSPAVAGMGRPFRDADLTSQ